MRDDQRPGRDKSDDINERFDDALEDLFGPDDEPLRIDQSRPGQVPQPEGDAWPPASAFEADPRHDEHDPHDLDGDHVLGPGNVAPPASYTVTAESTESGTMQEVLASAPRDSHGVAGPVPARRASRDWRRIACFGCLVLVGVPAICLFALIVWGLVADVDSGTPTPVVRLIDEAMFHLSI